MVTAPPSGVNLRALESRLVIMRSICTRSTSAEHSGGSWAVRRTPAASAGIWNWSTRSSTTSQRLRRDFWSTIWPVSAWESNSRARTIWLRRSISVTSLNETPRILMNSADSGNHWLMLSLTGHKSARDAVGAKIKLTTASGRVLYNHVAISVGFMSSSDKRAHLGLGDETKISSIEIRWPSGIRQVLKDVAADRSEEHTSELQSLRHLVCRLLL